MNRKKTKFITMNPHHCTACWECVNQCPKKAIGKVSLLGHRHAVFSNPDACVGCRKCIKTCPNGVFSTTDMSKPRKRIVRIMPLAFAATAITGIGLHIAGHSANQEAWHPWAVAHVASSILWLLSTLPHIKRHVKALTGTVVLLLAYTAATVTGLTLLAGMDGCGSRLGLWHFYIGAVLAFLTVAHAVRRIKG